MIKKIRGRYLKIILPVSAALLAAAALLLWATGFGIFDALSAPANITELRSGSLMGQRVFVSVTDILGDFAALPESYDSDGNVASYKERYCVVKVGDDYMGVCIRGDEELSDVAQYVSAISAYSAEQLASFNMGSVTGTVNRLKSDTYSMLVGWVQQQETDKDEFYIAQHTLPYVVEDGYLGSTSAGLTWTLSIFALLLVLGAAVLLIMAAAGVWERPLRAFIKETGKKAAEEDFAASAFEAPNLRMGPKHIYIFGKMATDIVETDSVVWAYPRSRRLEGGALKWSLVLRTADGGEYAAFMGPAAPVEKSMEELESYGYPLTTGYDKEKQRLYDKDLTGFVGWVKKHPGSKSEARTPEEE